MSNNGYDPDEEEFVQHLERVQRQASGIVAAAIVSDVATITPLDLPFMNTLWVATTKKKGARVTVAIPDELVRNATGPEEERDFVAIVHVPRAAYERMMERAEEPKIILPH